MKRGLIIIIHQKQKISLKCGLALVKLAFFHGFDLTMKN